MAFKITNGYDAVYSWFDHLKSKGHYITGYVIMPNHLHVLIAFPVQDSLLIQSLAIAKDLWLMKLLNAWKSGEKRDCCVN